MMHATANTTRVNRWNIDEGYEQQIIAFLQRRHEQLQHEIAKEKVRLPNYHTFWYRGFKCDVARAIAGNSLWAGLVHVPLSHVSLSQDALSQKLLRWPKDEDAPPFLAGIDFSFAHPYSDKEQIHVIGFHTHHLAANVPDFPNSPYQAGPDFVAIVLRQFIDTCLDQQQNE